MTVVCDAGDVFTDMKITSRLVTRLGRLLLVVLALGAAPLVEPDLAAAHVSLYNYKFPLPLWVFLTGGALAVLLSAPAVAFAVGRRRDWTTRSFHRWFSTEGQTPSHAG